MGRTIIASLLMLALGACSAQVGSSPSASASAMPSPSVSVAPSMAPSAEPSTPPSEEPSSTPVAMPEGHPAAGLTLVQFPEEGSPDSHIFVVEDDGSLRQVTSATTATWPSWSPDGTQIAFNPAKVGASVMYGVFVINADGTGERYIGEGVNPQWSPDGTKILFHEQDDVTADPWSIYVAEVATGEVTELTTGFNEAWLPDGRVAFHQMVEDVEGTPPGSLTDVLFVTELGGEPQMVGMETEMVWSPDDRWLLVIQDGVVSLAIPNQPGSREMIEGFAPVWSPDSTRFVVAYDFDENASPLIAVMNTDGEELWSGAIGTDAKWSADGTRIAVEAGYPDQMVHVLDAATGEILWEDEGTDPAWMP